MVAKVRSRFHHARFFKVLVFGYLWLMVGFTAGTAVLIGPVRWLAGLGREQGWAAGTEDIMVKSIIVLFVIGSFFAALIVARAFNRSPRLHVKIGIPVLATLFALASLYLWLNPRLAGSDVIIEESTNAQFTFGPYPEEADLVRLREEGYTAVISLLHPAVVPFEPVLQAEEEKAAERAGIEIIHLAMLPWVSENAEVLDSIMVLASSGEGRYYVHCYLGKDRVNVVRRVVENVGGDVSGGGQSTARKIDEMPAFERGEIVKLDEGVYLTPYPTDEEWLGFILAGEIKHIVSLLDPANPDDVSWIQAEQELASQYGLGFDLMPLSYQEHDPHLVVELAEKIRELPRPLVVHGFLSPSYRTEAVTQAYRSGLPPLAPKLFGEALNAGPVSIIAPNIAAGPRPRGSEFGSFLHARGVRGFIYVGDASAPEAREDSTITRDARLSWRSVKNMDELESILASGGPYYLYGPGLPSIQQSLASRFGPAVPDSITYVPERTKTVVEAPDESKPAGVAGFIFDFFDRALPGAKLIILLAPLLLLYTGIAGWFAGWLRVKKNVRAPYTRKVFHFLIFTMAAVLQITIGLPAVVLFGIVVSLAVVYACIRGKDYMYYEAMARPTDEPRRTLFILIPLASTALGGVIANLFFAPFAAVGYLVAGWGDAVGEPVGTRWGKHRYKVPSLGKVAATRSIEGSAAVFLVGTLVGFAGMLLMGISPLTALWVAAIAGLAGAAVEAFSNHGIDNLTVQVAVTAVAWLLLR